jgi:drug/metabolite transporter (DMT)-like permease
LAAATSYAVENVYISLKRPAELDAATALWGMTVAGTFMLLVTLWLADAPYLLPFDAGTAELSIALMAVVHLGAYAGLLYMLSHGGVVFASQVSYIVTPAAVMWGVVLLSEEISLSILLALALIMGGLALIKPRRKGEE